MRNDTRMKTPYASTQPIEDLFEQLEQGADFAEAGGTTYTDAQLVAIGYALVQKCGTMAESCRAWRIAGHTTWTRFKVHFSEAHRELLDTTDSVQDLNIQTVTMQKDNTC